ncbi:MAG: hypothetical protein J6W16_03000 [Methanobrevibacter sp.]|nr:hypothetical protein [Methanobrevibacter sp.]
MTHYEIDNLAKCEMVLVKADTIEEAKKIAKDTPSSKWEYRACNYDPKKDSMYEIYWLDLDEEGDIIEIKLIEQCDSLDVVEKFRCWYTIELHLYCDIEADNAEEARKMQPEVRIDSVKGWNVDSIDVLANNIMKG